MFCLTQLARRGKRRIVPRTIASLPTPSLRGGWGKIGRMSPEDRREVLQGAWRDAKPVRLLPDASDRDAGGFVEGVSFRTDEEAEAFLAEEMEADRSEHDVPALHLARNFFEELAATADSEVDMENALETTVASDVERAEEERGMHRQFFADFYVQQGIIGVEEVRAFVDVMLCPPTAMVMVNAGMPFVRLMMRCQLEHHMRVLQATHNGVVFAPHPVHPLLYMVDMGPTQRPGDDSLCLRYAQDRLRPSQQETQRTLTVHATGDVNALPACSSVKAEVEPGNLEVELMEALLSDETSLRVIQTIHTEKHEEKEEDNNLEKTFTLNSVEESALTLQPGILSAPLSVGHLYWLQRQMASDTLIDMDVLGVLLPLVFGRCRKENSTTIILDMSLRSHNVQNYSYGQDIAGRFGIARDDVVEAEGGRAAKTVIISLLLPKSAQKKTRRHGNALQSLKATLEEVPASEVTLGMGQLHTAGYHVGIENRITARGSSRHLWGTLRGKCDAVLCFPATTADGRRPRTVAGTSAEEKTKEAVANRFVSVCSSVMKLFPYLRQELAQALEYARSHGGVVVYATDSMNPLENEAVICSVLTEFKLKYPGREYRPVSLLERLTEEDADLLRSCTTGSQQGLSTWVPLQDGPQEQEPSYCDEEVVSMVARHSWRAAPLRTNGDVCFVCVIELHESVSSLPPPPPPSLASEGKISTLSAFPWLDTVRLHDRWGLRIHHSEGRNAFVAITQATLHTINTLNSPRCEHDYEIIDYGVSIHSPFMTHLQAPEAVISPSLSGTLLALALCDSTHVNCRSSHVLELPVVALLELLHTRRISLRRVSELLGGVPLGWDASAPDEGVSTVFLKAAVPSVGELAGGDMELHEAVADELGKLVVVALAQKCRSPQTRTNTTVLTLACATTRERSELEERVVAIGDALRYLLRRLGHPATVWGPLSGLGEVGPQVRDDEYEVVAPPPSSSSAATDGDAHCLLGRRERARHAWKIRKLGNTLRLLGGAADDDDDPASNWERDVRRRRHGNRSAATPSFLCNV
ncbi:hypothetical protein TraAM80_00523 [Trypanosoma rangeli]|uniref:Uncharacterized protein n=1 Tax=Trypanosoma rangeli TaxID=5698 RepID=A0A3R7KRC5_TRYRA|nr:uncharacterized protein TraAM80_00523 [Trypanosoma rangeli]RNF12102.1 hypothetical protein TraAM80_00523 [Trypanosoma rangeli]|eukprot:RNF12102.1 hypothetical protein TraAM80_00523 [Trypanosoma rangeli]